MAHSQAKLPIATFILGSGSYSRFRSRDGKLLSADADFLRNLAGRARLVLVEKPGVRFGEHLPVRGLAEFRRDYTLPRWVEAISAALKAARTLPGINDERLRHARCLPGSGERFIVVWRQWKELMKHPDDAERLHHGHSYRYWTSFSASSALQELPKTNARVFLAQGSADGLDAAGDLDVVLATLGSKGKDVTSALAMGADHGFAYAREPRRDGWSQIQRRNWLGLSGCVNP